MKTFLFSTLRVAKALVIGVFALVFVLIVAYTLINIADEDLKPEVATLLKPPAQTAPTAENAYLGIVGLAAPADAEPRAWAEQWIAAAQKVTDTASAKAFHEGPYRSVQRKRTIECKPNSESCLTKFAGAREATASAIAAEKVLLSRYDAARKLPLFAEVYDLNANGIVNTPIPNIGSVPTAQFLVFGRVAVSVLDDKFEDALADMEADIAFHRRIVGSSTSTFFRGAATEWLTRDLLVLSDLMRGARGPARSNAARIRAMTAPLSKQERDLAAVFRDEFRWTAAVLGPDAYEDSRDDVSMKALKWIAHRGFKPNASKNLYYLMAEPVFAFSTADPGAVEKGETEMKARVAANQSPFNPYNYVGRPNALDNLFGYADNANRANDLDGLLRLVHLQAAILEKRAKDTEIDAFIASQDKALADPYTGQPMRWDAKSQSLWFEPRSSRLRNAKIGGTSGRLAIPI